MIVFGFRSKEKQRIIEFYREMFMYQFYLGMQNLLINKISCLILLFNC